MNKLLLFFAFLFFSIGLQAQHEKKIHESFELDDIAKVNINIYGEHKFEQWEGNTILTETTVQLHDASPTIFKYYLEKGRYNIIGENADDNLTISSVKMDRKPIRTKNGECHEFVNTIIYYPDIYTVSSENELVKTAVSASVEKE